MTNNDRLPSEVLQQIFNYINDESSLRNCITVCKKWQEPATEACYTRLTLKAFQIYKIKALFEKKLPNQADYFNQLQWTKYLQIDLDSGDTLKGYIEDLAEKEGVKKSQDIIDIMLKARCKFKQQEFITLMQCLPNLQEIDFDDCIHTSQYMAFLGHVDSTKYLKRIERIYGLAPARSDQETDIHFTACYNFRLTLTHLMVSYFEGAPLTLNGRTGDLLSFLPDFECLTDLNFFTRASNKRTTVYDVSRVCPKLRSLDFLSAYSRVSDYRLNKILAKSGEQKELVRIINQNIQELVLHLPTLSSSYIELITKYSPTQLKSLEISLYKIDMYGWMEQVGWENALKLAQHLQLIPNASINFKTADSNHDASLRRQESRMTQFFKLFGAIKGNRQQQDMYCSAQASDSCSNHATITINRKRKVVDLDYRLGHEDFGESPLLNVDQEEGQDEEAAMEAYETRISYGFEMPKPDIDKSLIGPQVINNWSFLICRGYASIPFRLLRYAFVNCPRLQYLQLYVESTEVYIQLSASRKIKYRHQADTGDPSITSQVHLKSVLFSGISPTQDYLDLIATHLPNIESIAYKGKPLKCNDTRQPTSSCTINLMAFQQLKSFRINIKCVVDLKNSKIEYLLLHFKYTNGDEAFYSIQEENDSYRMATATQQFILDYSQNEKLSTKLLIFECSKNIEEFLLTRGYNYVGELRFGEFMNTIPDPHAFYARISDD